MRDRTILVTGFEPFGAYSVTPSEGLAKAVDGRRFGACAARGAVLPVHHRHAARQRPDPRALGLIHVPLLPAMVAATGLEQPSMDFQLMLRAVELALGVVASSAA